MAPLPFPSDDPLKEELSASVSPAAHGLQSTRAPLSPPKPPVNVKSTPFTDHRSCGLTLSETAVPPVTVPDTVSTGPKMTSARASRAVPAIIVKPAAAMSAA